MVAAIFELIWCCLLENVHVWSFLHLRFLFLCWCKVLGRCTSSHLEQQVWNISKLTKQLQIIVSLHFVDRTVSRSRFYNHTLLKRPLDWEGTFLLLRESAILEKWVPYSQHYLFNAIPDTNHNANATNPTNPTNPNTRYRCE